MRFELLLFGAVVAACDGPQLELGTGTDATHDAGRDAGHDAYVAPTMSCPPVNESEYASLRGATCTGSCSVPEPLNRNLSSPDLLAAALAGQWAVCAGMLGPRGAIGLELDPGCVVFFLYDSDGRVVRGTSATDQATYDVVATNGVASGVVLHLSTGDVSAAVSASSCLGRARLTTDAGPIDLATLEPPDATVAK